MSGIFNLNINDFIKGAVTAVFVSVFAVLWGTAQQPNFNVLAIDWQVVLNAAIYGFLGYLSKNLISDDSGAVHTPLGKIAEPPPPNKD